MGRTENRQENNPTNIQDHDVTTFTDSFNTELDITDDSDNSIEIGDNSIITQGDVTVERLDDEVIEQAFNFGKQAIESNERVVSGALASTTSAIRELGEDNQENFRLLTETVGDNAEQERDLAIELATLQVNAGQEALESAFNSTVGGLAEIQSENTKIIVGVVMAGLTAIAIFRKN